jgi:hypothetical protein
VPVEAVGEQVGEDERKPQALELFDLPRSHEAPLRVLPIEPSVVMNSGSISPPRLRRYRDLPGRPPERDLLVAVVADGVQEPW